jgi:hypothetical protein
MPYITGLTDKEFEDAVATFHNALSGKTLGGITTADFCKQWPMVKTILEALKAIPALAWVIALLIAVGDAYAKKHCPIA